MNPCASIAIEGLELSVHLGWLEAERVLSQIVLVDLTLTFPTIPIACQTDLLHDTYCYDALIQTLRKHTSQKQYHLIEHLGHDIYQMIKHTVDHSIKVHVRLAKKPAITKLTGVAFTLGDQ